MSDPATNDDRLLDLTDAVCEESASEPDVVEMDTLLRADQLSCRRYLNYCWMHAALKLELRANRAAQKACRCIATDSVAGEPNIVIAAPAVSSAPVGLSTGFPGMAGFFSAGWPVAYLIATVIFGVGMLVGALVHVSRPGQVATTHSASTKPLDQPQAASVGRVTAMANCRFEQGLGIRDWGLDDGSRRTVQGSRSEAERHPLSTSHYPLIRLGDKFALVSGLLEITYDTGAKVVLQGPVTYAVEARDGGYLARGRLTARVEKKVASGQWPVAGKSEISNPQSLIPNPSLATGHWPLFTIKTPTAIVTDLGTEFGVEVARSGETTSHVFRGLVKVQVVAADGQAEGKGRVLHENESARVEKGPSARAGGSQIVVTRLAAPPTSFVREIPKRSIRVFDLVDVVAGGDGFSGKRNGGIDPRNGRWSPVRNIAGDLLTGDGQYHRVAGMPLVDGVFIPNGEHGPVQVDSAGHTSAAFLKTANTTYQYVWAGGPLWEGVSTQIDDVDYASFGHGLLHLHANVAITFDLDAIRQAHPGYRLLRFRSMAADVGADINRQSYDRYADILVLVDGKTSFRRRQINSASSGFSIAIPVQAKDRFLTLAVTDGGDGIHCDWISFGDPRLEFMPVEAKEQSEKESH